jgi:endonuclease/exonuclease/phosphatase family metal-dependent hydrolase
MQTKITIIGIYAPYKNEKVNTKNQSFVKFNKMIANIGNTRELFLLGDFNDKTEKETYSKIAT